MAYGLSNGHVADVVMWPWKVKLVTPIRLERNILKLFELYRDFKFGTQLYMGNAERAPQIMFPESGRGLDHVTPTIFGIRSNISPKLLDAALYGEWRAGAQIFFPESERGLDLCLEVVSGHLIGLRPEHPLLLSDFYSSRATFLT